MDNPTEPCSFNIERQRKITPWGSAPNLASSKHKEEKHRDEKMKKSKKENGENRTRKSKEQGEKRSKKSKSKDSSRSAFPNSSSEASINKHEKKKLRNEEMDSTEKAEFIKKINRTNSSKRALPSLLAGLPNEAFRSQPVANTVLEVRNEDKDLVQALTEMISKFEVKPELKKPKPKRWRSIPVQFASHPNLVTSEKELEEMLCPDAIDTGKRDSSKTSHPKPKMAEFLTQEETPRDKKTLSYSKNIDTHGGKRTEIPISSSTPNLSSSKQKTEKADKKYKNGMNEKGVGQKISEKLAETFRPQPIMRTVLPIRNREQDLLKALTNMIADFHIEPKPLKPSKSFCVTSASHPNLVIDEEELDRLTRFKNAQLLSTTSSAVFHKKLANLVEKNNGNRSHEKMKHRRSLPSMSTSASEKKMNKRNEER